MRRKLIVSCIVFVLALCSAWVFAEEKPFLPDPGVSVKAQGELQPEEVEQDGLLFRAYDYSFTCGKYDSVGTVLSIYESKLRNLGFTCEHKKVGESRSSGGFSMPTVTYRYTITAGDVSAYLTITGNLFTNACTMTLYVPDGFDFVLGAASREDAAGNGQGTASTSVGVGGFQNDSFGISGGLDSYTFDWVSVVDETGRFPGSNADWITEAAGGFQNDIYVDPNDLLPYLDGDTSATGNTTHHVTCVSCRGTGTCSNCNGTGRWRNPYSGDWNSCDCTGGKCMVCDGSGVW